MKKKYGFTLIELLAVIVVLGIIATIAVPIVLNLIESSRKGAAEQSTISYVKAIETEVVASTALNEKEYVDKDDYVYDEIKVDVSGTYPTGGLYSLKEGTVTNGVFCVNGYEVEYSENKAEAKGKCKGEDLKLRGRLTLSETSGYYIYPNSGTFAVIENISGGNLSCTSSDENVAKCSITGTTVTVIPGTKEGVATLTITSESTSKYKEASVAYVVTTKKGLLSYTAQGYRGIYDGEGHGIVVTSPNAIIKYGEIEGVYDKEVSPTYTNVGEYTVYYEIEKAGYTTVTGSKDIVIEKAEGKIELEEASGEVQYNKTKEVEIKGNKSNGNLTVEVSDTNIVEASIENNKVIIKGKKLGVTTITVISEETSNYNKATEEYTVEVIKSNNTLKLSASSGTYAYPESGTFEVIENTSGGALSCTTSNSSVATCSISGTTVTVTPGTTEGNATITVKSEGTTNYNAGQAAYVAITSKGTLTSYTAEGYSGIYDGSAHGITVTSSGATITYSTDGINYSSTNPTYTNVGTYTVYYKIDNAGYNTLTGSKDMVITKAEGSVTAPEPKTLTYTGSAQELVIAGSSTTGEIQYKLDNGTYSTNIPTATNPGTYTVYYQVIGDKNHNDVDAQSVSVTINKAQLSYTAEGYSGIYDGEPHGITVISNGATIKYGTTSGSYTETINPTYTDVGTYTVYYQITREGYIDVTGSKTVVIEKANNTLTLSSNTGTYTYPNSGTFTVTKNTSGGTLSCSTSNSAIATCSISGTTVTVTPGTTEGNATITIKSAETPNYNAGQVAHVATTEEGLLSYTATGYEDVYDGASHGITVESSGATIKYKDPNGNYTLTTSPTRTNAGTTTVYYQITKAGYKTVTGSKDIVISKAANPISISGKTLTYTGSAQALATVSAAQGNVCYSTSAAVTSCSSAGSIPTGTNAGTYTVYYYVAGNENYNSKSGSVTTTIAKKSDTITLTAATVTYTGSAKSATFKTTSGLTPTVTYYSDSSCTTTATPINAGTYYAKATTAGNTNYNAASLGCTKAVTINTIPNTLTLSANTGTYTYPNSGTFTITKNTSGGALSCTSENTAIATCSISGTTVTVTPGTTKGTATLTITSETTTNYNSATASHVATTEPGILTVTVNGYSGTYDGNAHSITVTSSGSTITYSESETGTYSTTKPEYTDAGVYTTYYKVEKAGYTTKTGSKQVVINKKSGNADLSATSGTVYKGHTGTFTVSNATGTLSCSTSSSSIATCSVSGTTVTVTGVADGTATITINVAESTNYTATNKTYIATVKTPLSDLVSVGDYVKMTPTSTSYTISASLTGYTRDQTINPSELNVWRVIKINSDGTIEMVSEKVSSVAVYFTGQTGYKNFVGTLNTIAKQYENSNYTIGSRHMGYNGQTEYLTDTANTVDSTSTKAPWTASTSDNSKEAQGGGDTLYTTDTDLVTNALGTLVANNPSGTATSYWLASRYYIYSRSSRWNFSGRLVNASGGIGSYYLYYYNGGFRTYSSSNSGAVRPIVTLKSGLTATGSGTSDDPWVLG